MSNDFDYLCAKLHGRRSRMAESSRLDALCRARTVGELAATVFGSGTGGTSVELQRRLLADLASELWVIAKPLSGPAGDLLRWVGVRFLADNLKVLARAFAGDLKSEAVREHLVPVPAALDVKSERLLAADSPAAFIAAIPNKRLAAGARRAGVAEWPADSKGFAIESAIEWAYLEELLVLARSVKSVDREDIVVLAAQEADMFHLALAARGRLLYEAKPSDLIALRVRGARMGRDRLAEMLSVPGVAELSRLAVGIVIDAGTDVGQGDAGAAVALLESLAWARYARLANAAFRRSHMGLAAVMGYVGLRRVEVANLISVSEGVRAGVGFENLRRRLFPRPAGGAGHA